jgi:REP element-mobilizing transposase RayT
MPEYRRRLPHFQPEDARLFLTWRLWGSLPPQTEPVLYPSAGHAFVARDRALDGQSCGPLWLKEPRIADLVAEAIQIGARERLYYELRAWTVMPNHVHLLILPKVPVPVLMRWLKGSTARKANQLLRRTGQPFWQDESYDHYVRGRRELDRVIDYIEGNPVSAGLVGSAELWRWSSAGWAGESPAPPGLSSHRTEM